MPSIRPAVRVVGKAGGFSNPMTALGDIVYGAASGVVTKLSGGTTATKQFLTQTGDGTGSAAPSWGTLVAGDVPSHNHAASEINSGTLTHERGGIEADISAITTGGLLVGTTAGSIGILTIGTDGQVLTAQADGTADWENSAASGTGAPTTASYVTISAEGTLTAERILTGTANQITITDQGAGSTVTLATPQDIGTSSTVEFAGADLSGGTTTVGGVIGTINMAEATSLTWPTQAYTVDWTDYSGSTTVGGFSSTTEETVFYMKIGKLVIVTFRITGTSNATTITFTLPFTASNAQANSSFINSVTVKDNGTFQAIPGRVRITNSATATINKDFSGANFTSSGDKDADGLLIYITNE